MEYSTFDWILLKSQYLSTLGGDNKVNVAISDYKPNIKCDTSSSVELAWDSCVLIFVNMRATKQTRIFGYPEDPLVEEQLPLVLEARKKSWPAYSGSRDSTTNSLN